MLVRRTSIERVLLRRLRRPSTATRNEKIVIYKKAFLVNITLIYMLIQTVFNALRFINKNALQKEGFEKYLLAKHKNLLDKNLVLVANDGQKDGFVIQPKDGSYKITFSEKVFEEFFTAYLKEYSKKLLFS